MEVIETSAVSAAQPFPAHVAGLSVNEKKTASGKTLYFYQSEAVESVFQEAWRARQLQLAGTGDKVEPCAVSQPTAAGKSIEFYRLAIEVFEAWRWRTLLIVPTRTLIDQSRENAALELGPGRKVGQIGDGVCDYEGCDFVVATAASFTGQNGAARLAAVMSEGFELVIFDEAHHCGASTWARLLKSFRESAQLVVGFTATIVRGDGVSVASEPFFSKVVCYHSVSQLVEWGFLARCYGYLVQTGVALRNVRTTRTGDYNERDLEREVNTEHLNLMTVKAWKEHAEDKKTVVFCVSIAHAKALAQAFQDEGIAAAAVWGVGMSKATRRDVLKDYKENRLKVICNCQILIEGYDDREIGCTLLCRPVTAAAAAVFGPQCFGRCMRTHPDKPYSIIIEMMFKTNEGEEAGSELDSRKKPITVIEAITGVSPEKLDRSALTTLDEQAREFEQEFFEEQRAALLEALRQMEGDTVKRTFDVIERLSYASSYAWVPLGDGCFHMTLGGNGDFIEIVQENPFQWSVYTCVNDVADLRQQVTTREKALELADEWVRRHDTGGYLINRSEAWRSKDVTSSQLGRARRLGLNDKMLRGLTRGQASDLITAAQALSKKSARLRA